MLPERVGSQLASGIVTQRLLDDGRMAATDLDELLSDLSPPLAASEVDALLGVGDGASLIADHVAEVVTGPSAAGHRL